MENNDLTSALLKVHGAQEFMGGGTATHTMPDGTVMPGATHGEYEAMGMRHGGAPQVSNLLLTREMMENQPPMQNMPWTREMEENQPPMTPLGPEMQPVDPAQELQQAIEALQIQKSQTTDPSEIKILEKMIENVPIVANAPYAPLVEEMAATGGEDDMIAHVRSGDLNVSKELVERNPNIEKEIEKTAVEMGIDPEELSYGTGLTSLNIYTGMEQHGFFKKLAKGIKKVIKKVAPVIGPLANFIPGVGPVLAGVIGAGANLAAGKGLKGAITGGLSGFGAGKLMGGIGSLGTVGGKVVGSGNFGALGFGDKLAALRTGFGSGNMASAFFNPAEGATGMFGGQMGPSIRSGIGSLTGWGQPMPGAVPGAGGQYQIQPGDNLSQIAQANGMTVDQLLAANPQITDPNMIFAGQGLNIPGAAGAAAQGGYGFFNPAPGSTGMFGGPIGPAIRGGIGSLFGGGGGGGMFGGGGGMGGLGNLAMAGIPAYMLGKMAYDEAKEDKGVPLTPLTTMGPTGRYNIEAEIAKRMGTQGPNPIEYGLLPEGTIPTLSGGQPMNAAQGGAVYPMAYAEGGDVSIDEFNRMNGAIAGPGTETSDAIPAMLSDGEFVMTGEAVRGAGGYDLNNQDGILTLIPARAPDRENGTSLMYDMMGLFSDYVGDSRSMANV